MIFQENRLPAVSEYNQIFCIDGVFCGAKNCVNLRMGCVSTPSILPRKALRGNCNGKCIE